VLGTRNKVKKILEWFESLLLAPAIILGTPAKAGLNQKNSTSARLAGLGTQTAFDFHPPPADLTPCFSRRLYPKMLNGTRKKLSNLVLNFATYLWDTTLDYDCLFRIALTRECHFIKLLWPTRRNPGIAGRPINLTTSFK
jgi:hypothetical protein